APADGTLNLRRTLGIGGARPAALMPRRPLDSPAGLAVSGRELSGLRTVVTGSTGGIGRAIALELAAAGADVLIHGRRKEAAQAATAEVESYQVQSRYLLAEFHEPQACLQFADQAWEEWQPIDIWINNAGVDTLTGPAASWG